MTISPFLIYLWQLVDSIGVACVILFFIQFIATIILLVAKDNGADIGKNSIKKSICLMLIWILIPTFMPSSKTIAMMVIIPKIANNESIKKDIPELYEIAVESLKEKMNNELPKTP